MNLGAAFASVCACAITRVMQIDVVRAHGRRSSTHSAFSADLHVYTKSWNFGTESCYIITMVSELEIDFMLFAIYCCTGISLRLLYHRR